MIMTRHKPTRRKDDLNDINVRHGPPSVNSPENIRLWTNTPGTYLHRKKYGW